MVLKKTPSLRLRRCLRHNRCPKQEAVLNVENTPIRKDPNAPRTKRSYLAWTKGEEYTLVRMLLDISEDPDVGKRYL
ncbi:hypothetical protein Hanom_Chr12g01154711 [Helianthus anomalus]